MTTLFAPPELLSAYSYAVDGSDPDMPLQKGTHLRVFAGLGASFPLTPFAVFKIVSHGSEPHGLHVTDREGKQAGGLYLSQLGVAEVTPLLGDTESFRTVVAELFPNPADGIRGAQLLDQRHRVVAERDRGRFLFSAPLLHRFRLWGTAAYVTMGTRSVDIADVVSSRIPPPAADVLGLPIRDLHPWYIGIHDHRDGLNRVANGAPTRLNAMDQPDGPFDRVGADEEVARVEAMLNSAQLAGGLQQLVANLVDDGSQAPWLQVESQEMEPAGGGAKQFADVPRLGNLQMAALDPGLARFLGFAERLDDLPDLEGGGGWNALAVAGLFAIDPKRFDPSGLLATWLQSTDPSEGLLIDMIARALSTAAAGDVGGKVEELIALTRQRGLLVRAMIAVTAPVPPWLPPSLPTPSLVQHRWQTAIGDAPSSLYRAAFAFEQAPLASMAAVAGKYDGAWVSRHGTIGVGGFQPPRRATPRIFGHEQEAFSRGRGLKRSASSAQRAGLLADQNLPAAAGIVLYRFRASDFFGRFGEAIEFGVGPPPRVGPPPPVLRFHIERADIDLASPGPLSPGVLKLTFAVPQPAPAERFSAADKDRLASAIAVPAISELAAGSQRLKQAKVTLDVQSQLVDLTATGLTEVAFTLPQLLPQETRTLTLTATFTDTDDVSSAPATGSVKITDMRPPKAYPTGIGLFWTSSPGPAPEVELKLAWPAPAGSLFRVYATDQEGLGLTAAELAEPVPGTVPSRGRVAEIGGNKVLGGAPVNRAGFRLLTDEPIKAGADARAVLDAKLPRSMETVQFLRVVPLSAEGAEAPFDTCGIVPVAVPDSRYPPLPQLDGTVDPATGIATLTVVAAGFDGAALRRDEPGLFTPGADGAVPPQFRVRRAVGAVADPIYGRSVATGTLTHNAGADPAVVFSGTVTDGNGGHGLEPFVRYVYWADVRLPPERRLPAGVAPVDPPGGIIAVDPSNAADHTRPMSLPSAPRVLMHLPPNAPAAPLPAAITATRGALDAGAGTVEVSIEIADPPKAHAKAIGPYRLAVWTQLPGQDIQAVTVANGVKLDGTWPDFSDGAISVTVAAPPIGPGSPITLRLAFVDPAGRLSDVTTVSLP